MRPYFDYQYRNAGCEVYAIWQTYNISCIHACYTQVVSREPPARLDE